MLQQIRAAIIVFVALSVLTGVVYPAVVTAIAQLSFPRQANGSLIRRNGQVVGSELIGQPFSRAEYFWGRLSATGPAPYNAEASSGSNFGPLHPGLKLAAESRMAALKTGELSPERVPVDLVTASASGLDPHISPAAAEFQAPRIAAARNMSADAVRDMISLHTAGRQLGVLGERRVNVLQLNLLLDQQKTR